MIALRVGLSSVLLFLCTAAFAQVELVIDLLGDQDKDIRALAYEQIRKEVPGEEATKQFAALLPKLPAETQVGLLSALADRGDKAAASAVRDLAGATSDEAVRTAAVKAIGSLGGPADLAVLLKSLVAKSETERDAARASLVRLPDAVPAIAGALKESEASRHVTLLEILAERRGRESLSAVLESAQHADASVRRAAIAAVAELGGPDEVPGLVTVVLKTSGRERESVERAVAAICRRVPDPAARAAPVLSAMKGRKEAEQRTLLATVGRIGGPAALAAVDAALQSSQDAEREAGVRALCNWPDGSTTGRLLTLARTSEDESHRKLAFQALIRTAPIADERSDRRRLDTVRTVLAMCSTDAERNQVLDRAKAIRSLDTLHFLLPFLDQPAFAQQACLTIVELAHHVSLREANREEFHTVLDRVQTISRDEVVKDRAQRYKTGQTWYRPKKAEGS